LRRRKRLLQASLGNSKRLACRPASTYDEIVPIDGDPCLSHLVGNRNDDDASVRIGQAKTFSLDACCGINHRGRDKIDEIFDQLGLAGRNVERSHETPFMIIEWSRRAAQ
jgi:hypothetical protein